MNMKELNIEYKAACKKSLKNDIDNLIEDFLNSEVVDEIYKDKVISMIITLLTLK